MTDNAPIKEVQFSDKTYRIIQIGNTVYKGKDSFKNRTSDYITGLLGPDYFNGKTVLDLGCASGAILFNIRDQIKLGVGIDIDSKKLSIGQHIINENNIDNIKLYQDRMEDVVGSLNRSFDCIFILNILHHTPDPYMILNLAAEFSDDMICIEAPLKGRYSPYPRDYAEPAPLPLDVSDIKEYLIEKNYELLKEVESDNQKSFMGSTRCVLLFKKKEIKFTKVEDVEFKKGGIIVGPNASGKTTIMNKLYGNKVEVQNTFEAKDETIVTIKNGIVVNENPKNSNQKTLKYSSHLDRTHRLDLDSEYPFVFVQPTYKSVQTIVVQPDAPAPYASPIYRTPDDLSHAFVPNIDAWIDVLKTEDKLAIVCYMKPYMHRERLIDRWTYYNQVPTAPKKKKLFERLMSSYPFWYQSLFYKLERNNIDYIVIKSY